MTNEEKQQIVADVLSAIRTNSATIEDLTEVSTIPEGSYIELSGGRKIKFEKLVELIISSTLDALASVENTSSGTEET